MQTITNTNDLISIIIPVYNVQEHLNHCLNSVIKQTYTNLEIICINDGSTDNSLNILQKYSQKDNRIKIINKQNGGLSSARNAGLKAFTGEYVFFLDSDDYIHPQTIEILYNGITSTKTQISECNYITINKKINSFEHYDKISFKKIKNPLKAFSERKKYFTPSVWKRLYSKEIIQNMLFIENIVWEDVPFTIELYNKINELSQTYLPLYFYYQNGNSISNTKHTKFKYDCHFQNILFINNFLKNKKNIKEKCIGLLTRRILNDLKEIKDNNLKIYIQQEFKLLHKEKIITYKGLELKKYYMLWKLLNKGIKNEKNSNFCTLQQK